MFNNYFILSNDIIVLFQTELGKTLIDKLALNMKLVETVFSIDRILSVTVSDGDIEIHYSG